MANSKITDLTELTSVDNADVLVIVDDSASETKKISFANLSAGISVGNATQLQFTALNNTGSTITKGAAVYISGYTTDTQISLADNSSAATMPCFGLTSDAIANGATGVVVTAGELSGVNTSSFTEGDELYVGTGGALTATKPTGTALIQKVAKVAKAAGSGDLLVMGAGRVNDIPNLPDGNIWIGDSSGVPQDKTLTAGTNVTITEDATTVTIAATGGGGSGTKLDGQNIEYEVSATALSADGDFEGMVAKVGDAGNTLTAGDVYYWNGLQNDWVAADNSAEGTSKGILGIALGTSGTADGVLLSGVYYYGTPPGSTAGDVLYLSTSGDMTEVAPTTTGEILRVLGQRLDGNRVMFMPSQDFVEIGTTDLNDLSDVTITGTPAAGEVLINNATSGQFVNATLTAGNFVKITNADGAITIGAGDGAEVEYRSRATAVSAAGEVEGSIVKFGTTTGLTEGSVYVWNGTDWVAVDADAEATTKGLMGVALGTAATSGFLTHGTAYLSHDPGTAGDILYVDTVTAGYLTSTQPSAQGDFVRVAGYCLADNKVFFSPSQDFIEIG